MLGKVRGRKRRGKMKEINGGNFLITKSKVSDGHDPSLNTKRMINCIQNHQPYHKFCYHISQPLLTPKNCTPKIARRWKMEIYNHKV